MINILRLVPGRNIYFPSVWKLVLFFIPLIASCATFSTKSTIVRSIITEPAVSAENIVATNFSLTGRISIQDDNQRFSGGIRWQHTETGDEIFLQSPLGQIMAQIVRDSDGARLTTSDQEIYYATDMEKLTEDILGWRIPLTGLQYWVEGTHSPATVSIKDLDINDRVVTIRQDGWKINYIPAQSLQKQRPRVLALSYETIKIRLVVDSWETQ